MKQNGVGLNYRNQECLDFMIASSNFGKFLKESSDLKMGADFVISIFSFCGPRERIANT